MILIHLLAGLVFGVSSVIFSIYAGHGFFLGLLRYSVFGAGGMLLSAALSLVPIGGILQFALATVRPTPRGKALAARSGDLRDVLNRGAFGPEVGRTQES